MVALFFCSSAAVIALTAYHLKALVASPMIYVPIESIVSTVNSASGTPAVLFANQRTKYQKMGFHECQPLSTIVVVVVANEMSRVPYHHGSREVHSALNYTANTRARNRTQTHTLTFDKVAQIVKVLEGVF